MPLQSLTRVSHQRLDNRIGLSGLLPVNHVAASVPNIDLYYFTLQLSPRLLTVVDNRLMEGGYDGI